MSIDVDEWEQGLHAIRSDGESKNLGEDLWWPDRFDIFADMTIVTLRLEHSFIRMCDILFGGFCDSHCGRRKRMTGRLNDGLPSFPFVHVPEFVWPVRSVRDTSSEVAFPRFACSSLKPLWTS